MPMMGTVDLVKMGKDVLFFNGDQEIDQTKKHKIEKRFHKIEDENQT